jgi:DNA replication licensing factor MCM7
MKIRATGLNTRVCSPGDNITVTGVFMPQPFFGFRAPGLTQDTYLEAFLINKDKISHGDHLLSDELMEQVANVRGTCENDHHILTRIAESICPEIWGMSEVKQALLL